MLLITIVFMVLSLLKHHRKRPFLSEGRFQNDIKRYGYPLSVNRTRNLLSYFVPSILFALLSLKKYGLFPAILFSINFIVETEWHKYNLKHQVFEAIVIGNCFRFWKTCRLNYEISTFEIRLELFLYSKMCKTTSHPPKTHTHIHTYTKKNSGWRQLRQTTYNLYYKDNHVPTTYFYVQLIRPYTTDWEKGYRFFVHTAPIPHSYGSSNPLVGGGGVPPGCGGHKSYGGVSLAMGVRKSLIFHSFFISCPPQAESFEIFFEDLFFLFRKLIFIKEISIHQFKIVKISACGAHFI